MKAKARAEKILLRAQTSSFWLWVANRLLWRLIPFNKTHKPTITELGPRKVTTRMSLRKNNQNHLGGMHACALATLAEYTCGIVFLRNFGGKYRIIMKSLRVDYHVQCRTDSIGSFVLDDTLFREISEQLNSKSKADFNCSVNLTDEIGQTVCTAQVEWQLKDIPW